MRNTTICICGGGSLGLVCAGVFASKGVTVNILTGHPDSWNKSIKVYAPDQREYEGQLNLVSSDPSVVIPKAGIVLLTLPGYLIADTLKRIRPYLSQKVSIGSIVSSTGFFFNAHSILGNKYCLFGFQRVPYIARVRKYGETGDLLGFKASLNIAIENCDDPNAFMSYLESLFDTPMHLLRNFYEASLTNSNPLLHTSRLYSMWHDYDGTPMKEPSMFYAEWTDDASEYLVRMDEEFQTLLRKLNIRKDAIPTILDYYEVDDVTSLTTKLRSIKAFRDIMSPLIQTSDGWMPDFSSRYFTEDFPYGLRFIKELATANDISTPIIDKVYAWGMSMSKYR